MSSSSNNDNQQQQQRRRERMKRNDRRRRRLPLWMDILDDEILNRTIFEDDNDDDDDDDDNDNVEYDWTTIQRPFPKGAKTNAAAIIGAKTMINDPLDHSKVNDMLIDHDNDDNNPNINQNPNILGNDNTIREIMFKWMIDEILEPPTPSIIGRRMPTNLPQIAIELFTKTTTTKIQSPPIPSVKSPSSPPISPPPYQQQKQQQRQPSSSSSSSIIPIQPALNRSSSTSLSKINPIKLPEYSRQQCDRFAEQFRQSSNHLRKHIEQIFQNYRQKQLEQEKKFEDKLNCLQERYSKHQNQQHNRQPNSNPNNDNDDN